MSIIRSFECVVHTTGIWEDVVRAETHEKAMRLAKKAFCEDDLFDHVYEEISCIDVSEVQP
jgi:hypothetical protein